MRSRTFLFALALSAAAPALPAQAGGYGVYSGAGINPSFEVWTPGYRASPHPWQDPAPLGTAANPAPVPGPATVFQVQRRLIVNTPPSRGVYRIVPHP